MITNASLLPVVYGCYIVLSVSMTIWVARTLHRNGRAFLVDAFRGDERIADSVNHLLVVGFYLINLGYVSLMLRSRTEPGNLSGAIELVSYKIGWVLLILGTTHFFNLYVFYRLRANGRLKDAPPPVTPEQVVAPGGAR